MPSKLDIRRQNGHISTHIFSAAEIKMQSVTSLVTSLCMLPQSTPIANSKGVQYNREVGRPIPVRQQQVRIPHIRQQATTSAFGLVR
jgi:hypothetical protein